jgi:hypothetical protein
MLSAPRADIAVKGGITMRKIVIGSGLGLVAAAIPAQAASLPLATAPAGVSDAGRIDFAPPQETQGVLIGLNKPGVTPEQKVDAYNKFKAQNKASPQVKMNPYDKMNAAAQLKIKGESQIKLNGDGLKTGDQLKYKEGNQIKLDGAQNSAIKFKSDQQLKLVGSNGIVRPNCLQTGQ